MRKGQLKILDKAKKLSPENKEFLKREDLSIKELEFAFGLLNLINNREKLNYEQLEWMVKDEVCNRYEFCIYNALNHNLSLKKTYLIFSDNSLSESGKDIILHK